MTRMLLTEGRGLFDEYIVCFANTGREHPKTLDFIKKCDDEFGFNTVWLEAVVDQRKGKQITHKVIDYDTASRDGQPFEDVIRKYGIPNVSRPHCSDKLKKYVMSSYIRSLGLKASRVPTAIGIRNDESRRVSGTEADVIYPLIDIWSVDREHILLWWEDQTFDLEIDEFEGNCQACYKKSFHKLHLQMERDPSVFDWTDEMERKYGHINARSKSPYKNNSKVWEEKRGCRSVFFRGGKSTQDLRDEHVRLQGNYRKPPEDEGGCSESCEPFATG